jgi:hypothetical protein
MLACVLQNGKTPSRFTVDFSIDGRCKYGNDTFFVRAVKTCQKRIYVSYRNKI